MCRLKSSSGSASPGHDDEDDDILMDTAMMMMMTMMVMMMMMMMTMMVMKERMKIPFQGQRQWQLDRQWRLPGKNHNKTFILMMMIMIKMIKIIKKVMGKITIKLDDQVEYFSDVGKLSLQYRSTVVKHFSNHL